ncbi:MAG TPA: hypothetical protein VFX59_25685, partial [Polyangiales bacterium]|nr:hypothetical protein [Polyangiales bacterium]
NPYALGSERENAARFERFLATPEAKSVAGHYYLGFPELMEIAVGDPATLARDGKGKLVPVDSKGEEILKTLDGYQGPDAVKANKKGMRDFPDWEKAPLDVKKGIQRVLLSVVIKDARKACVVEVEHLDGEHAIGGFTFVFRPDDENAALKKDCI